MGQDDLDSRSAIDRAEGPDAQAPEAGGAAAGSLMSVQIRRTRTSRKRPPPAPAEARDGAQAGEPLEHAAARATAPAPEPAPGAVKSTHETRQPEDITAYWSRLRGSRPDRKSVV